MSPPGGTAGSTAQPRVAVSLKGPLTSLPSQSKLWASALLCSVRSEPELGSESPWHQVPRQSLWGLVGGGSEQGEGEEEEGAAKSDEMGGRLIPSAPGGSLLRQWLLPAVGGCSH